MGALYRLVNHSKREVVSFAHIGAGTRNELAGNPVAAAITTRYLQDHAGDAVAFVSDTYDDWPFLSGSRDELATYTDMTDDVVESLLETGVLVDEGREYLFDDEPEVYTRRLRNVWFEDSDPSTGS